jgi:hypothetical protein
VKRRPPLCHELLRPLHVARHVCNEDVPELDGLAVMMMMMMMMMTMMMMTRMMMMVMVVIDV